MNTDTITYTSELCGDMELRKILCDTLDCYKVDFPSVVLLDPETILDAWHDSFLTGDEDDDVTTAQLVQENAPELIPLFEKLKELEEKDIWILF